MTAPAAAEATGASHPASIVGVLRRAWPLFEQRTRRRLGIAAGLSAAISLLDVIGIGLASAALQRADNPDADLSTFLPASLIDHSAAVLGIAAVVFFATKTVASWALVSWQFRFANIHQAERASALFRHYVELPYERLLERESTELIRNIHISVTELYTRVGSGIILLTSEGFTLLAIALLIVFAEPVTAAALLPYLLIVSVIYLRLIRGPAVRYGERYLADQWQLYKHVQEAFNSIKTVVAYRLSGLVGGRYAKRRRTNADVVYRLQMLQVMPRYYLELALLFGLVTVAGVTAVVSTRAEAIGALGLFAATAARAMPSLTRVLQGGTFLRSGAASVAALEEPLGAIDASVQADTDRATSDELHRHEREPARGQPVVSAADVSFIYSTKSESVLRNVSLEVSRGELVAIFGPSGSGKTTLVDLLLGLLAPTEGVIETPPVSEIGYVPQDSHLWDGTIRFNIELDREPPAGESREQALGRAVRSAQLTDWVASTEAELDTPVGEGGKQISGGQKQRIGIARAMYGSPALLVFDEPTAALDPGTADALTGTLKQLSTEVAVIVVTHSERLAGEADRVFGVDNGSVRLREP